MAVRCESFFCSSGTFLRNTYGCSDPTRRNLTALQQDVKVTLKAIPKPSASPCTVHTKFLE